MCETPIYRACISAIIRLVLYFTVTQEDQSCRSSRSFPPFPGFYTHSGMKPRDHCTDHFLGVPRDQRPGYQREYTIHDAIGPDPVE